MYIFIYRNNKALKATLLSNNSRFVGYSVTHSYEVILGLEGPISERYLMARNKALSVMTMQR